MLYKLLQQNSQGQEYKQKDYNWLQRPSVCVAEVQQQQQQKSKQQYFEDALEHIFQQVSRNQA